MNAIAPGREVTFSANDLVVDLDAETKAARLVEAPAALAIAGVVDGYRCHRINGEDGYDVLNAYCSGQRSISFGVPQPWTFAHDGVEEILVYLTLTDGPVASDVTHHDPSVQASEHMVQDERAAPTLEDVVTASYSRSPQLAPSARLERSDHDDGRPLQEAAPALRNGDEPIAVASEAEIDPPWLSGMPRLNGWQASLRNLTGRPFHGNVPSREDRSRHRATASAAGFYSPFSEFDRRLGG